MKNPPVYIIYCWEEENAFAKHLKIFHPECEGGVDSPKIFNLKVLQTFKKPLEKKVAEAALVNNSKADIKINSKALRCPE